MIKRALAVGIPAAGITFLILYWRHGALGDAGLQHWLAVHTGTDNEASPYYGFFSGSGADISEAAIFGTVAGVVAGAFRKHNCHEKGCPRIGRHTVDGSPWCDKHHQSARDRAELARQAADPLTVVGAKIDRLADEMADLAEAIRASLGQPK